MQEIEARLAEIRGLLETSDADLDALQGEVDTLTDERTRLNAAALQRANLVARVAGGEGTVIRQFPTPERPEQRTFDASSPEFRSAWLKNLAHNPKTGEWRLGELTEIEQRAFTYTTATTPDAIPSGVSLGIVDLIAKQYALLGDLSPTSFTNVVEFLQAGPVVKGAVAVTNENTANAEDKEITFAAVTMTGVEIRGSVVIGAKMRIESIDGFEAWLITELSREMGELMNVLVFDTIDDDMLDANKNEDLTDLLAADVRGLFALLKGGRGQRVVYANNFTIWTYIAGVVDENGKEKFIESSVTDDPTVQGRIYGTVVKLDETLADGVIFVGYPATIKANMFQAPNVLSDIDVKTRAITYGGYALFEARLGDSRAWAKATITAVS
jgi:HK97 family phage major capsid protein